MNREIKFRAWDGDSLMPCDVVNGKAVDSDGDVIWFWHQPAEAIMQFTGLLDKNGKEIYEGDILEYPSFYETPEMSGNPPEQATVIFENGLFNLAGSESLHYEMEAYDGDMCVVGNIHENPELLEAK